MTDSISAAKLAVYLLLVQPAIYCLWKHGKTGFLGWFYVKTFSILRIITGAIGLHGSKTSTAALILSSIGLSPLLLATAGVLHEARRATNPRLNRKLELFLDIQYHTIVAVGMVLIVIAVVNAEEKKSMSAIKPLLDIGCALAALSWLLLIGWAFWSVIALKTVVAIEVPTVRSGKTLLNGVFAAIPFIGVRLIYAITFLQLEISNPESSFLTSKAAQVILGMIPEMLCMASLLYVGLKTLSLKDEFKKRDYRLPDNQSYVMSDREMKNGEQRAADVGV